MNGKILPAVSSMKEFEAFIKSDYDVGVFLELHIGQLKAVNNLAMKHGKRLIYHVDLIHGIRSDDYATEFLCQEYRPYGLISTKANVILKAKQKGVIAIQRVFLLDSHALDHSYKLLERTKPDYIEVLPGVMPTVIEEVREQIDTPLLAGGFIRTVADVNNALAAGAYAVTTSKKELWNYFSE
ncbi:glycerol-3-phosphate responsive antiterminator [Virgibacillus sp. W0181]|uniref:glycerol-3-phosphate responsive antiterminator n=1 Tax=Virgibacillus sp. W0181 TaxID=3391581 RepID=UPI003F44B25A